MKKVQKMSFAGAGVAAASLALLSTVMGVMSVMGVMGLLSFAQEEPKPQKTKPEYIQATAQGTSTQLGKMVSINIIINEYSTADDQKGLMEAFQQKGNEGLFHAVDKMKAKGRIAITGTLGYDLNYIRQYPMPDGARKIRFVTDRPITFGEAWSSSRSMDYNLSGGEIILSKVKDKNTGTIIPAAKLQLDKEKHLEIEAFQNPWKLVNIMVRK